MSKLHCICITPHRTYVYLQYLTFRVIIYNLNILYIYNLTKEFSMPVLTWFRVMSNKMAWLNSPNQKLRKENLDLIFGIRQDGDPPLVRSASIHVSGI